MILTINTTLESHFLEYLMNIKYGLVVIISMCLGMSFAFTWDMNSFPESNQSYTIEITSPNSMRPKTTTMNIDITYSGNSYNISTNTITNQQNVPPEDVLLASFNNDNIGMVGFDPMAMFGEASFMISMFLTDQQNIQVSNEVTRVVGLGSMSMPRSIMIDGHECVVVLIEMEDSEQILDFAIAENIPLPCYINFGQGEEYTEFRLTRIQN